MTPADVRDLTIRGPLISPWLLFVEPRDGAQRSQALPAPSGHRDLPKAA